MQSRLPTDRKHAFQRSYLPRQNIHSLSSDVPI
eukprot:UN07917